MASRNRSNRLSLRKRSFMPDEAPVPSQSSVAAEQKVAANMDRTNDCDNHEDHVARSTCRDDRLKKAMEQDTERDAKADEALVDEPSVEPGRRSADVRESKRVRRSTGSAEDDGTQDLVLSDRTNPYPDRSSTSGPNDWSTAKRSPMRALSLHTDETRMTNEDSDRHTMARINISEKHVGNSMGPVRIWTPGETLTEELMAIRKERTNAPEARTEMETTVNRSMPLPPGPHTETAAPEVLPLIVQKATSVKPILPPRGVIGPGHVLWRPPKGFVTPTAPIWPLHRDSMPGLWISGPAGVGKSYRAARLGEKLGLYVKDAGARWDGYDGERCVVVDDLDVANRDIWSCLQTWVDSEPFVVEVADGVTKTIRPLHIIVTSRRTIRDMWPHDPNVCRALDRRFVEANVNCRLDLDYVTLPRSSQQQPIVLPTTLRK